VKTPNELDDPDFDDEDEDSDDTWVCDVCGKFMYEDTPCPHCDTPPPWWEGEWEQPDPKELNKE